VRRGEPLAAEWTYLDLRGAIYDVSRSQHETIGDEIPGANMLSRRPLGEDLDDSFALQSHVSSVSAFARANATSGTPRANG
jgi:hypothetical protein